VNNSKQPEHLMTEASNETKRSCIFRINDFCMISGLEEDRQSLKSIKNVDENLPEGESFEAEYDKETGKESVHYNGQVLKDIIETNDEKEILANSLKSSLRLNQHTDMLIEEERSKQHTEVLPKEEEV